MTLGAFESTTTRLGSMPAVRKAFERSRTSGERIGHFVAGLLAEGNEPVVVVTGYSAAYYCSFQQQPPFPAGSVYEGWGASHFAEPGYVFNHLDRALNPVAPLQPIEPPSLLNTGKWFGMTRHTMT